MATVIILAFFALACYGLCVQLDDNQRRKDTVERGKKVVESIGPKAQILVNNGVHLFYMDDVQQVFGIDHSGKTYSYEGLISISKNSDSIYLYHKDTTTLVVGKDIMHKATTVALKPAEIEEIYLGMMMVLRTNVSKVLQEYDVVPTHVYEHDGTIIGCDLNSEQFYIVDGSPIVFRFSDLKSVKIDDVSNNSLCSSNYIIRIHVINDEIWDEDGFEYEIYFDTQDADFYGILAMLKGIRNRQ